MRARHGHGYHYGIVAYATTYVRAPSGRDNIARTIDDPGSAAYLTSEQWGGTVHVTGVNVVPDTEYFVRTDCGTTDTPTLSVSVVVTTQLFGDTGGGFNGTAWAPPDGTVDFTDISGTIDRFRSLGIAPSLYRCDLVGCSTDRIIDFVDISAVVDGFRGLLYNESSGCPLPCGN